MFLGVGQIGWVRWQSSCFQGNKADYGLALTPFMVLLHQHWRSFAGTSHGRDSWVQSHIPCFSDHVPAPCIISGMQGC